MFQSDHIAFPDNIVYVDETPLSAGIVRSSADVLLSGDPVHIWRRVSATCVFYVLVCKTKLLVGEHGGEGNYGNGYSVSSLLGHMATVNSIASPQDAWFMRGIP